MCPIPFPQGGVESSTSWGALIISDTPGCRTQPAETGWLRTQSKNLLPFSDMSECCLMEFREEPWGGRWKQSSYGGLSSAPPQTAREVSTSSQGLPGGDWPQSEVLLRPAAPGCVGCSGKHQGVFCFPFFNSLPFSPSHFILFSLREWWDKEQTVEREGAQFPRSSTYWNTCSTLCSAVQGAEHFLHCCFYPEEGLHHSNTIHPQPRCEGMSGCRGPLCTVVMGWQPHRCSWELEDEWGACGCGGRAHPTVVHPQRWLRISYRPQLQTHSMWIFPLISERHTPLGKFFSFKISRGT